MVLRPLRKLERMLTRRDLTRLFVRVFGLLILLHAVVALPTGIYGFILQLSTLVALHAAYTWQTVVVLGALSFGLLAIEAAMGLCFLCWSGRIVDRASLAPERGGSVETTDLPNIEITLVAALGLYFIADGFAELCRWSLGLTQNYLAAGGRLSILFWDIPFFVESLVKLVIGILLVLGRGGSVAVRRRAHAWVRKWRNWSPFMPPNFDSQEK
jgi:hypothetical protein